MYALPARLIDALATERVRFLSEDALRFERDLARTGGQGFFRGWPIYYSLLPSPQLPQELPKGRLARKQSKADELVSRMLDSQMGQLSRTEREVDQYHRTQESLKQRIRERQVAYAGWLVTEPLFQSNRNVFRKRWKKKLNTAAETQSGGADYFPTLPKSLLGESSPPVEKSERGFFIDYLKFYRAWGLETLATWDLPVAMKCEFTDSSLYDLSDMSKAGILLFVPWYLLRDGEFTLRELSEQHLLLRYPREIYPWLEHVPKNVGYDSYARMLELYVYLKLAIEQRYTDQQRRGTADKLDHAFAAYFYDDPLKNENVRKLRQAMNRKLKQRLDDGQPQA